MIKKVAVVGCGTMGRGIVHTFAQFGYQVNVVGLTEASLEEGLRIISVNLDRQVNKGTITPDRKEDALNNIRTFTDLKKGTEEADLVIEAVTERIDLKLGIFKDLDSFCKPEAILASNTSSISITKIASVTKRAHQVIGMHFMNPVPMMKLVEVIRNPATTDEIMQQIMQLSVALEKFPVEVNDSPGFVANRILMPMINEAIYTLHEGVAGVEEIDNVMKLGMGHPMGPLQLADFIGLDVCLAIINVLFEGFQSPKYAPCPLLIDMVAEDIKGVKSGNGFYDYSHKTKDLIVSERFRIKK